MSKTTFAIDYIPLLIFFGFCALLFFGWRRKKEFFEPHLKFSDLPNLLPKNKDWKVVLAKVPEKLFFASIFLSLLAFIDPRLLSLRNEPLSPSPQNPVEGIAIYFVLDQSGSMVQKIPASDGSRRTERKIDLLKQVTTQFIKGDAKLGLSGRSNDMIGLIAFARGAQVLSPLTLDHRAILDQLAQFKEVGSMDQDGTAIGYAIYKAGNLIAATNAYAQEMKKSGEQAYTIKSYAVILVTDGLQDPNPLDKGKRLRNIDIPEAAEYLKKEGIRLYAIIIEPKIATGEFAPYRNLMDRVTKLTGGKFFMMDNSRKLQQIYKEIDQLEKSRLPEVEDINTLQKDQRPDLYKRFSLSPYLLALALFCLFLALLLSTTVLRKSP